MKKRGGFCISTDVFGDIVYVVALSELMLLQLRFLDSEEYFMMGSLCLLYILILSKTNTLLVLLSSSSMGITSSGLSINLG